MVPSRIALLGLGLTLSGCTPANSPDKAPEKTSDNTPDVPDCMAKPPWVESTSPDAVPLEIHVENKLVGDYRAKLVCISVDGHVIPQSAPRGIGEGFAKGAALDMRLRVDPKVAHHVEIVGLYTGTGELAQYRFSIRSVRIVEPADLRAGARLAAVFESKGGPDVPPERRPAIEWKGPGRSSTRH